MYSSTSVTKRLALVPILSVVAIQLLLLRSVSSLNMTNAYLGHKCFVSQGKYKPGSEYEKNLHDLIDGPYSTHNFTMGLDMGSRGNKGPSYAAVTHSCRGDSYGPKCRSCYATALPELRRRCPRFKGGIIWYDHCFLEISNINTLGRIDYDNNICIFNAKKLSIQHYTNNDWMSLISNLTTIAISEKTPSLYLYAAGERRLGREKLYGMVQCTQDLYPKGCLECVRYDLLHFQDCLRDKQGARVVGRSCNIRFELYPFVPVGPNYLKT